VPAAAAAAGGAAPLLRAAPLACPRRQKIKALLNLGVYRLSAEEKTIEEGETHVYMSGCSTGV